MQIIRNLISRLTIVKSGIVIYDTVVKKELYHWTDYYFDEKLWRRVKTWA